MWVHSATPSSSPTRAVTATVRRPSRTAALRVISFSIFQRFIPSFQPANSRGRASPTVLCHPGTETFKPPVHTSGRPATKQAPTTAIARRLPARKTHPPHRSPSKVTMRTSPAPFLSCLPEHARTHTASHFFRLFFLFSFPHWERKTERKSLQVRAQCPANENSDLPFFLEAGSADESKPAQPCSCALGDWGDWGACSKKAQVRLRKCDQD
mmetsp:Transcript_50371/g.132312  ORF Transcript_50371/g.132312 Transcript_50371/m.132312 type:complete len:211 (-) Transcript_50371:379-1011(-)